MGDEMTVNTDVTPEEAPATETTPETGGESHVESHDDGGTKFTFSVDENGNRSLSLGEDTPTEPEEAPQENNEAATNPQQENPTEPAVQPYENMEQVVQAAGAGNLDPARLTQEQQQSIIALQQRQQMEQQRQQFMAQQQAAAEQARQQAFSQLAVQAKAAAMQELGISDNDLTNADFVENGAEKKAKFEALYNKKLLEGQYNYIQNEVVQQQRMEAYNQGVNEIQSFCADERVKNPHFQQTIQLMETAKNTMPYNVAAKIFTAEHNIQNGVLTHNDIATFRQYYDHCKKLAYQNAANVTTKPKPTASVPNVERAGTTQNNADVPHLNTANLRSMNQYQRDKVMQNYISQLMSK